MKLQVKDENSIHEINLEPITQLAGLDYAKKEFILDSLCKYFSSAKYREYEQGMIDNIQIDGQDVGRNYYNVMRVNCREDLINLFKMTKNGLLIRCLEHSYASFDNVIEMNNIKDMLEKIYIRVNEEIFDGSAGMKIDFEEEKLMDILQKSVVRTDDGRDIEFLGNYIIMRSFLGLVKKIQEDSPGKVMLIINGADKLFRCDEYIKLCDIEAELSCSTNTWFINTFSSDGYVYGEDNFWTGINAVNEEIFQFEDVEVMLDFLFNNYPIHINDGDNAYWKNEILKSVNMLGNTDIKIDLRKEVIAKMINCSLGARTKCYTISAPEIAFIQQ